MTHVSQPVSPMIIPSAPSTAAFIMIVLTVSALLAFAARRAYRSSRAVWIAIAYSAVWIGTTSLLDAGGILPGLLGTPKILAYVGVANGAALALALSSVGARVARSVPVAALVGFHAFRLPLELVLHEWYEQGTLPEQMTYEGHNFDIVTGVAAVLCGLSLIRRDLGSALRRRIVMSFNLLGTGLLLAVMSIAIRSTPGPARTYWNDPPVQLVAHAPYTWIVPICVAGALFGHIILFRWLWLTSPVVAHPAATVPAGRHHAS